MGAIAGGLGAAAFWALGTLCSSRASRTIGAGPALGWVMAIGLLLITPFVIASGRPAELDPGSGSWLAAAGIANLAGLVCIFTAFRVGKVSIIAPIASAEGAFAAILAVVAGEHLMLVEVGVLAVIACGIAMAAASSGQPDDDTTHTATASVLALAAAALFGFTLYATARASDSLPVAWVLVPARLLGALALALPLAFAGRLKMTREALPLVLVSACCEVLGLTAFALGSRDGVAVTAVIGSQFAGLSAVAAFILFRERLARIQVVGVAATVAGVACLSALVR
ncbi:MAG: EamA family transporter [Tepidiformaceae bacterium]